MASAYDVASYLVRLASIEDEPEYLGNLRLQKLMYYVQSWSIAQRDRVMFPDRIEAWSLGPVVPDLYAKLASHGDRPIQPESLGGGDDLDDEDREFIASIWETYKDYSATSLRRMVQQEPPWIDARRGVGPAERSSNEITVGAMRDFFIHQGV